MSSRFYKNEMVKIDVSGAIDRGYSEIEELAGEMREWADNLENGNLGHTQKCEAAASCADTLESVAGNRPEEPEGDAGGELIEVAISVPRRRGKSTGRAVRRDNAVSFLTTAKDAIEERISKIEDELNDEDLEEGTAEDLESKKSSLEEIRDQLDNDASEAEGAEFPGMYG